MKSAEKVTTSSGGNGNTSGKKLIQARLPFKVLSSKPVVPGETCLKEDTKKRKLSFGEDNDIYNKQTKSVELKENCPNPDQSEIVILSDDDLSVETSEVPDLKDDDKLAMKPIVQLNVIDDMVKALKNRNTGRICLSPKTPKLSKKTLQQTSDKKKGSSEKLIIKLPLSGKKKRKISQKENKTDVVESDSEVEIISSDLNPQKKLKIDPESVHESSIEVKMETKEEKKNSLDKWIKNLTPRKNVQDKVNSDEIQNKPEVNEASVDQSSPKDSDDVIAIDEAAETKEASVVQSDKGLENTIDEDEPIVELTPKSKSKQNVSLKEQDTEKPVVTPKPAKKQQEIEKRNKEKQKQKEERERKIQEEKLQKQKEKEDKERQRKREKEEREELKRKEKEEKDEQRRKEKEEKEKKRLAEIEAKNEERRQREDEKRKKEEAKEEERKKKEEERRKKELEKEEAENKKKKAAEAFTKFFVQQKGAIKKEIEDQNSSDADDVQINRNFMPFQVKGDMKLAPIFRRTLSRNSKKALEDYITGTDGEEIPREKLYIESLKNGKITVGKDSRTWLKDDDSSDLMIVEDELEGAGQTIDANKPIQKFRAKLFLFHENRRPPYYGTWRKKSKKVNPRRPFAMDKDYFDYEIDSDDEWEEEEPGESLHGSDDEKESEDEYEVDNEFFVPHGHLSDEELQNEDELEDDNSPETQKAKLKILQQEFAQEMKKKTEKIKPRLVGIVWQDEDGRQPDSCPSVIWQSLTKRAMLFSEPFIVIEPESLNKEGSPSQEKKQNRPKLTEELVKDLITLVHFNRHKKQFLIKEFKAFLGNKSTKDPTFPEFTNVSIKNKIDKIAKWNSYKDEVRKKSRMSWIVSPDVLKKYGLEDIGNTNKWSYTLQPKSHYLDTDKPTEQKPEMETDIPEQNNKNKTPAAITKFTKVLTDEEKKTKFDAIRQKKINRNQSNSEQVNSKKAEINSTNTAVAKKRVPLLMSVPRGQKIPQSSKNELISKFLQKGTNRKNDQETRETEPMDVDPEVIEII